MLRHLDFLTDIINKKIIEHFKLSNHLEISIYKEKSQPSLGSPLYLEKLHIITFFYQILKFSLHNSKS